VGGKRFIWIEKGSAALCKAFVLIASLMMAALMLIVCADLGLRYFYNAPMIWATEVTEILLLYITFLGAAQVFRDNSHVVIDIFLNIGSERRKRILSFFSTVLVGIVSVILIYYGFITTYNHYVRGVFNPTILETPIALIIIIIPVGCIPLFLEVLVKGRKAFLKKIEE
jgi:C4-dicarboxylate transporter, DctQ subunit